MVKPLGGPSPRESPRRTQRASNVLLATSEGGFPVTLGRWSWAQSGKEPSWKMGCAQVLMAMLSIMMPIRFIRRPVRT